MMRQRRVLFRVPQLPEADVYAKNIALRRPYNSVILMSYWRYASYFETSQKLIEYLRLRVDENGTVLQLTRWTLALNVAAPEERGEVQALHDLENALSFPLMLTKNDVEFGDWFFIGQFTQDKTKFQEFLGKTQFWLNNLERAFDNFLKSTELEQEFATSLKDLWIKDHPAERELIGPMTKVTDFLEAQFLREKEESMRKERCLDKSLIDELAGILQDAEKLKESRHLLRMVQDVEAVSENKELMDLLRKKEDQLYPLKKKTFFERVFGGWSLYKIIFGKSIDKSQAVALAAAFSSLGPFGIAPISPEELGNLKLTEDKQGRFILSFSVGFDANLFSCPTSNLSPVTVKGATKAKITLEDDQKNFRFVYPASDVSPDIERHSEGLRNLAKIGGYVYTNDAQNITKAVGLEENGDSIYFDGPNQLPENAQKELQKNREFQPITIPSLRNAGALEFAWMTPFLVPDLAYGGFAYKCQNPQSKKFFYVYFTMMRVKATEPDPENNSHREVRVSARQLEQAIEHLHNVLLPNNQ